MSRKEYTIEDIARIVRGAVYGNTEKSVLIRDILIDSRRLIDPEGCLFFALTSRKNDGHKYIDELYKKGVRSFVVSIQPDLQLYDEANFILVSNTHLALQQLAATHRKSFEIPVIGVTGSNGKTIVKEWLFQLLNEDLAVIRSPKSYNSQIGVPLSVWQTSGIHEMAIFEAGVSEPDEMDKLQRIILPTIGIFTNIGQAHNENFIHNVQKIGEKLKLFTKVDTLIYCLDHHEVQETIIKSEILNNIRTFTWSTSQKADLSISGTIREQGKTRIIGTFGDEKIEISIPFTDHASIENAIHCWATMLLLGYNNDIIARRMLKLQPIAMRLELKEGINNCSIINDSYNSDINSLSIALDFLNQQKQHTQKTLILSDILQSGRNEIDLYAEIGQLIRSKGINKFVGIGPAVSRQADSFDGEKSFFPSTAEFLKKYSFSTFHNESILLKGARIFEFEQISKALQQKAHETVLEVNLNALVQNYNYYKSKLKAGTRIMAMVKAFSYGSGSFEIANVLQFYHVDYLAVAFADEGIELRKAGINVPIMVMNPDEESFDGIILHSLEPEVYNFRVLELLEKAIEKNIIPANKPVKIHIKLDTGMHRLGFEESDLDELIERLTENKMIYVQSVFSHLAASDDPGHDEFSLAQIELFSRMNEKLKEKADHPIISHILNSGGILRFPDAQFDMVRLGISLYGISSSKEEQESLEHVSTLKTTISQIKEIKSGETIGYNRSWKADKDLRLAIVPIGYADGLKRSLSNGKGKLFVNGKPAKIVGDICMDMCMIDVTEIQAEEGNEVIVFGKEYPITKLAKDLDTIPYEVLTNISRRVKRVYFQE